MEHSQSITALATALAKAQGSMGGALKDSENPFFKSKYADLESVWSACRKPLADNGLSVIQGVSADDSGVMVTTLLAHESGEWIRSTLRMVPKDSSPQVVGSCTSYARRYGLASMVGVYQSDDDAEAAQRRAEAAARSNGEISHPPNILTGDKRTKYLPKVAIAIEAKDAVALRKVVAELNEGEQKGLWSFLSMKQKTAARELLQKQEQSASAHEYVERFREALQVGIDDRILELHEECPALHLEISTLLTPVELKRVQESITRAQAAR